ncbi:hypothetical protein UH38_09335 [Aliterella atlantica CENA595]|uniref:Uncharacterized protein n=1 Tax=Aliterella atlantica CENA595 TaxID=1618023 RepID=A0A0D8ZXR9_9CYAN|nr:hypothetical protein UH38_09335 [Aliterella atlantica CENA595]
MALLLSSLALLGTGLTLFQVSQLRQELSQIKDSINTLSVANSNAQNQVPLNAQTNDGTSATYSAVPPNTVPPVNSVPPTTVPNTTTTQAPATNAAIQPGQFVQPVFGTKGRIELLRVNRVEGQPDIVNVQMRVRVLRPQVTTYSDSIYLEGTTARNLQTTATYKAVSGESTGSVSLFSMKTQNQTSADAYVWLQIPKEVSNVDIYIPNTQAFQNVPIAN